MTARRVVVVGNGMAGARLAGQIRRHDPDGTAVALTVLGAEPHPPYNRVLLSSVLAGSLSLASVTTQEPDWGRRHHAEVRTGTPVLAIDRAVHRIRLAGGTVDYDTLVLATGSRPLLPPIAGLFLGDRPADLAEGVVPFRTMDDCQRIAAAAETGRPIVVVGGGVLGLEAARALAGRGHQVTVVHPTECVMDRQLDPLAGRLLARTLAELGVGFRLGRQAVEYRPGHGLTLDDGTHLPAGLVVLATGVRPDTELARHAGLRVGRGVLVDDQLRTSDPAIRAIGDCAEHPGSAPGLVESAYAQADVLAELLTAPHAATRYPGTATVTRLKARDVELTALGESQVPADAVDAEVLCLSDPKRGRYAKLVLRADRVTGAILLGLPDAAATITQFFDSGAPAPTDRLALLLGRAEPAGVARRADPAELADVAVVCRCNSVTKGRLVRAWRGGARDTEQLIGQTRASTGCGTCRQTVCEVAGWLAGRAEIGSDFPASTTQTVTMSTKSKLGSR